MVFFSIKVLLRLVLRFDACIYFSVMVFRVQREISTSRTWSDMSVNLLQVHADSQVSNQHSASPCHFCAWFKRTLTEDWTQRFSSADLGAELWTMKGVLLLRRPGAAARRQPEHPELLTSLWVSNTWAEHQHRPASGAFSFSLQKQSIFSSNLYTSISETLRESVDWMSSAATVKTPTNVDKRTDLRLCDCHPLHQLKVCSTLNPAWECRNLSLCWAKSCVGSTRRPNCTLPVAQPVSDTLSSKHQQH